MNRGTRLRWPHHCCPHQIVAILLQLHFDIAIQVKIRVLQEPVVELLHTRLYCDCTKISEILLKISLAPNAAIESRTSKITEHSVLLFGISIMPDRSVLT